MKRSSILFSLWAMQGLVAAGWLALLPTDTEHGLIFGFSATRLALIAGLLALTGISAFLAWYSAWAAVKLPINLCQPIYLLSIGAVVFAPLAILVLRSLGKTSGFIYTAYAGRLAPLAFWLTLSALELAILVSPQMAFKNQKAAGQSLTKPALFALLLLGLLAVFIGVTRLGVTRYNDGSWGSPTTPLLEWQILLALFASLVFFGLETRWQWLQTDRYTTLFVYSLTCLVWLSQPINPGYFATAPRAPNFEIYPFSDALIYAQYAQSALAGNGFMWPDVPTRPLYISFLTWLHVLGGQDYTRVIGLQTLVLALFPVVLYLLGKELAGRPLGLGLALLAALRDLTANVAAPFALNYTYTKLFFSEIPTALLLCLFTLMMIRWVKKPQPLWYPLLAGGLLGLSALIRLQSAVLLAAVIPISFFVIKNPRRWLVGCVLVILGLTLALTPWLVRNRAVTGGIVLDNPVSQTMVLARRWSGDNGNQLLPRLPGEGDAQYSSRMTGLALASLRADPGRILGSAANHFLNNEIGNLLIFPLRDQLNSPAELIWPEHAFWQAWNGQPTRGQLVVIIAYLGLFGLGLAAAWRNHGLAGLLPMGLCLVYNVWTALFLSSGDRFLVPMDWAVYFYLFLGLFTLASLALGMGLADKVTLKDPDGRRDAYSLLRGWKQVVLMAVVILMLGASVPLTELAFPRLYVPTVASPALDGAVGTEISLRGRAIYPRWYAAGDGEPGSAKLGYGAMDEPRLVFFLVGERNSLVICGLKNAPETFQNAANVSLSASLQNGFLRAQKMVIEKDGKNVECMP